MEAWPGSLGGSDTSHRGERGYAQGHGGSGTFRGQISEDGKTVVRGIRRAPWPHSTFPCLKATMHPGSPGSLRQGPQLVPLTW